MRLGAPYKEKASLIGFFSYNRPMKRFYIFIISGVLMVAPFVSSATTTDANTIATLQAQVKTLQALVAQLQIQVQAMLARRGSTVPTPQYLGPFSVHVHTNGLATTVVKGSPAETMAYVVIDASGLSEHVKVSSLPLTLTAPNDDSQKGLNTCQLYDGATMITTGANVINLAPSKTDTTSHVFLLDAGLVIPAKTIKTLTVKCNIIQNPPAPATYAWGVGDVSQSFKGATSNTILTPALGTRSTRAATLISDGSFVVELDASSPVARSVKAGSSDVVATVLDFYASGESVELQNLGLKIDGSNSFAASRYTVWDGMVKVGEGALASGDRSVIAKLSSGVVIPRDAHRLLTVKIDLAPLGGRVQAGDTVTVNFNGANGNFNLTHGLGKSSGVGIIPSTQRDTASALMVVEGEEGVSSVVSPAPQVTYEKFPIVHPDSMRNGLMLLYRFKVAVGAEKFIPASFTLTLTHSQVGLKDLKLYAFTNPDFNYDAYTINPVSRKLGMLQEQDTVFPLVIENTGTPLTVPAGGARYFELRATVTSSNIGAAINVNIGNMATETFKSS
ncbi:MAG: hypothetical protein A2756_02840 [Candidatus Ryanbacteria bacterium RIFCSPHIGHO2_01_FULL_48_27]|uniref:Uncharacterized protein n=1 Tax=Candidatus Ryanbacteria bacterium RIFCSPHIGHO2_01_FULL_48_27 TaxID=1802115 RepID=A0A1G2G7G4_9BACT|nr:MAG: hypothetical protein A2756_02840 [Candidatus Ryanbacteria bacterium RIFCSPHIGHO2_01_FULL_48_27]